MMKMNKREILWRVGIPLAVAVLAGSMAFGGAILAGKAELRRATGEVLPTDAPMTGIGRAAVRQYGAFVCAGEVETGLPTYTEGDGPAPEWYDPTEPMAAEWVANDRQMTETNNEAGSGDSGMNSGEAQQVTAEAHPPEGIDAGGIDWNLCTDLEGWDGHRMEVWEMDLYSRIVYLEFWGTSPECCEAGADSILRLWESGYFGSTLGGVLSAVTETGAYCYSTYPAVWETDYDPDGLADMRALCEKRFEAGPEWDAEFFQLGGYPDWACPMYELDGVYFSTGKGWQ